MFNRKVDDTISSLFRRNKKCIVNADLDGVLSGMLLQEFLDWEIVGYSSCCGRPNDEVWIKSNINSFIDCIFVDLPVYLPEISVIDQHFVAFEKDSIDEYNKNGNKVNPNIIRERVFKDENGQNQYTGKYPFGTVHFVLAVLENLGIIDSDYTIEFKKKLGDFDLADLLLRADRVIGNTYQYTPNCFDWSDWIMGIGGKNTKNLFSLVKNEYRERKGKEAFVETKLKSFGCAGSDGDCSNLFRSKDYSSIKTYFEYLSSSFKMSPLPVFVVLDYGKLHGRRFEINNYNLNVVKKETLKDNVFSFAFVMMRTLSLTYIDKE